MKRESNFGHTIDLDTLDHVVGGVARQGIDVGGIVGGLVNQFAGGNNQQIGNAIGGIINAIVGNAFGGGGGFGEGNGGYDPYGQQGGYHYPQGGFEGQAGMNGMPVPASLLAVSGRRDLASSDWPLFSPSCMQCACNAFHRP